MVVEPIMKLFDLLEKVIYMKTSPPILMVILSKSHALDKNILLFRISTKG